MYTARCSDDSWLYNVISSRAVICNIWAQKSFEDKYYTSNLHTIGARGRVGKYGLGNEQDEKRAASGLVTWPTRKIICRLDVISKIVVDSEANVDRTLNNHVFNASCRQLSARKEFFGKSSF